MSDSESAENLEVEAFDDADHDHAGVFARLSIDYQKLINELSNFLKLTPYTGIAGIVAIHHMGIADGRIGVYTPFQLVIQAVIDAFLHVAFL